MNELQSAFIGLIFQSVLYGLYIVIFVLYLRIQIKRKHEPKGLLFYTLIVNFILCTTYLGVEIARFLHVLLTSCDGFPVTPSWLISLFQYVEAGNGLYAAVDFISQAVLIYRCWIVWRRAWIVAIPSMLSLAFLITTITSLVVLIKAPGKDTADGPVLPKWWGPTVVSFFSTSLAVNAVVTGLIIFKIVVVHRSLHLLKSRPAYVYGPGPSDLYPIISILVESGLITFLAQLVMIVLYKVDDSAFGLISGVIVQLYGISPTVVLVRVVMGVSYDNKTSKAPSRSLNFAGFGSSDTGTQDNIGNQDNTGRELKDIHSISQINNQAL